jgi:hypothetical protein
MYETVEPFWLRENFGRKLSEVVLATAAALRKRDSVDISFFFIFARNGATCCFSFFRQSLTLDGAPVSESCVLQTFIFISDSYCSIYSYTYNTTETSNNFSMNYITMAAK